ncbi:MAG: histidine kinase, partial [Oryzihumus sp.]
MTVRGRSILLTTAGAFLLVVGPLVGWRVGHLTEASRMLPQTLAFLAAGALATLSRPDHRGARRLMLVGLVMAVGGILGSAYSAYLLSHPVPPWGWQAVLALQVLDLGQGLAVLALLAVFPDGRYHRPVERAVVLAGAAYVGMVAVLARVGSPVVVFPGVFIWGDRVSAPNPHAQPALRVLGRVAEVGYQAGFPVLLLSGIVVLAVRFRRFEPMERRQTAWPLLGAVVTVATGVTLGALGPWVRDLPGWLVYVLYLPAALALPVTIGIGMLRHRLLDIDSVIRRSLVYAVLWLLIAVAYVAVALVLGNAVGGSLPLPAALALTVAATLVAAPVRHRLERLADRLVFGRRVSGYELISRLGARLEGNPGDGDVARVVAADVRAGLGAQWVRVVLDEAGAAVAGSGGNVPSDAVPALSVPLVRGSVVVGAIECGPKPGSRYTDTDRDLLASLGRQAALAVHNSWLASQLESRVEELAASRARIVQAEDAGRRRLERDLHDGVQQELVALLARIGLARNQLRRGSPLAEESLEDVQRDGQRALVSLQEVARGILPPLLTDRGLHAAIAERAARLPIPVEVRSTLNGAGRFPIDVEGAAYFVVMEALANILKHARAASASVHLEHCAGRLHVVV